MSRFETPASTDTPGNPKRFGVFARLLLALTMIVQLLPLAPAAADTVPWIASDKDDYPPGALVVLTGGGWQPAESVQIVVDDDQGKTWKRTVDVAADAEGGLSDSFNLPDWFVATYQVTATGAVSGTAKTSFTDGNVKVDTDPKPLANVTITRTLYGGLGCTGTAQPPTSGTGTVGVGGSQSLRLDASATATEGGSLRHFSSWTTSGAASTVISGTGGQSICVAGFDRGNADATAHYVATATTSTALTSNANPSTYGDTVTFTSTVTASPSNPSGAGTVTFRNGTTVLCSNVPLTGNTATCTTAALTAGGHAITAAYGGATGYASSTSATLTQNVNKKTVTGGFTAANKVYDGTTSASITDRSLSGAVGSDNVTLSGGTATFGNKDVGNGKTVTGTGFSLAGTAANNYALASATLTTAANITAKGLTVGFTAADKVYDGTTAATITGRSTSGVQTGDVVTASGGSATFANKNVGNGKPVTASGFVLGGADGGNYSVQSVNPATANITPKSVTGSFTAGNKQYDGNTSATVSNREVDGAITGDNVSLSGGTASFNTKNVGTDKPVTLTGAALAGADADNYTLGSVATATANITAKALTGSFTADDKQYDGTRDATVASKSLSGVIGTDGVTLAVSNPLFDTKRVGNDKDVTGDLSLGGDDADNYSVNSSHTATADITARALTVTFTAGDKDYDGTPAATINSRTPQGLVTGDMVVVSGGEALFDNANAGSDKDVTASGFALSGSDAGNYSIDSVTPTTADIRAKAITGGFTAADKTYDGNTDAAVTDRELSGVVGADEVTLTGGTAAFANKNVGANKTVTLTGATLAGDDKANYILSGVDTETAAITAKAISGNFTAANKVYDGNTSATVNGRSLNDTVGGDNVSLTGGTATFDNASVGTDKTVTLTGATLTGADAGNYTLTSVATTTANITAKALTGSFTAADKIVDGNTSATVTGRSLNDTIGGDNVSLTGGTATFDNASVGTNKTVTLTGATLTGTDADNYTLTSVATAKASILYGWNGFLQPINDTAHQTGVTQSKFKLGQTIPAKFVIRNASGQVVQQVGNPTFSRSGNRGSCDTSATLETPVTVTPDSGSEYKWDGSQYHYNWSTKGLTSGVYRINANLADGSQRWVDICLTK